MNMCCEMFIECQDGGCGCGERVGSVSKYVLVGRFRIRSCSLGRFQSVFKASDFSISQFGEVHGNDWKWRISWVIVAAVSGGVVVVVVD